MPSLTFAEINRHAPDLILPPDPEFVDAYWGRVERGRLIAKKRRAAFVAICRNAMPFLPLTLELVSRTGELFADWRAFVFENDSEDGTKDVLSAAKVADSRLSVAMTDNGRPHLNYTKSSDRTIALAEYRNNCRLWCEANCRGYDYAIVFDTDAWGGWSIDGIANTIGHLEDDEYSNASGMGSYSWAVWGPPVWPQPTECQYDAWACRWTWWQERQNMLWFHLWHPPVGSPPVRMNSCFGQLGVYRMGDYISGTYAGGDCEHVAHWKSMGGDCYLNPSQRVVSFWVPEEGE
jgi:hypothetical protein